ncbi:MAG: hypothetical protein KA116_12145 [Proteobacteria bacterium]|nr:hypothetical protein [Pseudomonadota bacterium]
MRFLKLRLWTQWIFIVCLCLFSKNSSANLLSYCKVLLSLIHVVPQSTGLERFVINQKKLKGDELNTIEKRIYSAAPKTVNCSTPEGCYYRGMVLKPQEIARISVEGLLRKRTSTGYEIFLSNSLEAAAGHATPSTVPGGREKVEFIPVIVVVDERQMNKPALREGYQGAVHYTQDIPPSAITHIFYFNREETRFEEWIPPRLVQRPNN